MRVRRLYHTLPLVLGLAIGPSVLAPSEVSAIPVFGAPSAMAPHASTDDPAPASDMEIHPSAAGDGAGNWVAVWYRRSPFNSPTVDDVVVTRSSDDGRTWSASSVLASTAATDRHSSILTDRQGVWIATWRSQSDNAVLVSRSVDNGLSWSAPVAPLGTTTGSPRIATDGLGTWVIVAEEGQDGEAIAVRSIDNGMSWSAPSVIDGGLPQNPTIATDGAGNWVAAWQRGNVGGKVAVARSTDNAASWQPAIEIGDLGTFGTSTDFGTVAVATDRGSRWVTIWENDTASGQELRYSTSADNGASWSPQASFPPAAAREAVTDYSIWTSTGAENEIYAQWSSTRGPDSDLFISRSLDGGVTWSSPALVNLTGTSDGSAFDIGGSLGYDGSGTWISTWISNNTLNGTVGADNDILFARAHDDCPASPMVGCKTPTVSGKSVLRLRDDADGSKDQLSWIWRKGQEVLPGELGDPTTSSSYVFCLYDNSGSGYQSVFEADAGAALTCEAAPCWSGSSEEFTYRDRKKERGAIATLQIDAGDAGRAKVKLKAKGDALGAPRLPLAKNPSVKAQLLNLENNTCWEATYSSVSSNNVSQFKAVSD